MIFTSKNTGYVIVDGTGGNAWIQSGNAFGAQGILGTQDDFDLQIIRNGYTSMLCGFGYVGFGTTQYITLSDDGSASFANTKAYIGVDGNANFSDGSIALNTDGSGSFAGLIFLNADGSIQCASGQTFLNGDGSASFANGDFTIDINGSVNFLNNANIKCKVNAGQETLYFTSSATPANTQSISSLPALVYGASSRLMGSPSEWIRISINGTSYKIPCYN